MCRLIEAVNFETDEALLTGESLPVEKQAEEVFSEDTGPGDRLNIAFSSSTVTKGRAKGIVFATGMFTEIGTIAVALRAKGSKVRPIKRKEDGSAGPHRYAQAYGLTATDAVGRFLGVNVGTPLQKKLSRLAVFLFGIAVLFAIIVLAANKFARYPELEGDRSPSNPTQEVAIYAVATGLSMIPAALIVVLTITMAAGTKRMVERHVIVRRMDALEALGGITDICSDKTGTLTQGKMVAKKAWIPSRGTYSVGPSNEPFNPTSGDLSFSERSPKEVDGDDEKEEVKSSEELMVSNDDLQDYLNVAGLANLATVHFSDNTWKARGDPTEVAIKVFASRFQNRSGRTDSYRPAWKQLAEYPFDSDVKKMSVIYQEIHGGQRWVFTKGAVERVIGSCSKIILTPGEEPVELTEPVREEILANMEAIAALGLRCLALASREFESEKTGNFQELDRSEVEQDLVFRGLIGLYDPPRPESEDAVKSCHQAGISVHMLTGDHPGTAKAIAQQVGILPSDMGKFSKDVAEAMIMTAGQFDKLSDDEIDKLPVLPLVIARCAPQTKVRMIEALHRRKRFCAMTGDGVNDSPSLKRADVGIAMGESGSDVAKDASDIILTDDNFASILNAIEEGRRMFDNIQKFVLHLLAQNVAQACVLLIGLVFKDSNELSVFPLAPVEVMWIIMVTSGIPDMGLGFEIAAPDIMDRPPVSLKTGIFQKELLVDMLAYGLIVAALCLGAFTVVMFGFGTGNFGEACNTSIDSCELVFRARATTFACLTWFSLFLAWEMIDMRRSFFRMQPNSKRYFTQWFWDVWRNKFLFCAVAFGIVSMFPILYIPVINEAVFLHTGIKWEWAIVFIAALLFFLGCETWKWAKRVFFRRRMMRQGGGMKTDLEHKAFGEYMKDPSRVSSGMTSEEDAAAVAKKENA